MSTIRVYRTITEFFSSINLPIEQDLDFTIHDLDGLHGRSPISSPFFRTNYYVIMLIREGKSFYNINDQWFSLGPNSFYFTNPGHLKAFSIEEELQGYMITFSEDFLKTNYPGNVEVDFSFLFKETVPVMYLPGQTVLRIAEFCQILLEEYRGQSLYKIRMLANNLANLLFQTKELLVHHKIKLDTINRPSEIAHLFRMALQKNIESVLSKEHDRIWGVKDFAAHLHIHPNHLSNTIKTETGKTVKQFIDEKVTIEAKILLKNRSLTIAQAAYRLSFDDVANFSRFFKRNTGQTPNEYRTAD